MKLDDLPGTSPDALSAIRATSIDDPDFGFHELDCVFGADPNAASAEVAFAGNDMNHQWCVSCHELLITLI
jgi:hypothetical protein